MVTFEEFKASVFKDVKHCPSNWRKGQAVFNVLDAVGLARKVQHEDGIDCFYNDDAINDFIAHAYAHLSLIENYGKEE